MIDVSRSPDDRPWRGGGGGSARRARLITDCMLSIYRGCADRVIYDAAASAAGVKYSPESENSLLRR